MSFRDVHGFDVTAEVLFRCERSGHFQVACSQTEAVPEPDTTIPPRTAETIKWAIGVPPTPSLGAEDRDMNSYL